MHMPARWDLYREVRGESTDKHWSIDVLVSTKNRHKMGVACTNVMWVVLAILTIQWTWPIPDIHILTPPRPNKVK